MTFVGDAFDFWFFRCVYFISKFFCTQHIFRVYIRTVCVFYVDIERVTFCYSSGGLERGGRQKKGCNRVPFLHVNLRFGIYQKSSKNLFIMPGKEKLNKSCRTTVKESSRNPPARITKKLSTWGCD